jgi:hypothetical protein
MEDPGKWCVPPWGRACSAPNDGTVEARVRAGGRCVRWFSTNGYRPSAPLVAWTPSMSATGCAVMGDLSQMRRGCSGTTGPSSLATQDRGPGWRRTLS